MAIVPGSVPPARHSRLRRMAQFYTDVAAGRLPAFTLLDPNYSTTSEENPQDIQVGERFVASVVRALISAPTWSRTALFFTWDEHGGYYDHVPPPRAIRPDAINPIQTPGQPQLMPGTSTATGSVFRRSSSRHGRGPATSPVWSRTTPRSRPSSQRKWNLPAMTFRDANAAADDRLLRFHAPRPSPRPPQAGRGAPGWAPGWPPVTPPDSTRRCRGEWPRPARLALPRQ